MKNNKTNITECLHIYARASPAAQINGHSLDLQVKEGIEMAKSLGYSYQVYREERKTSNIENTMNQPLLSNILRKVKLGEVQHIFVTDIDRLTRDFKLSLDIQHTLLLHGVIIHSLVRHEES